MKFLEIKEQKKNKHYVDFLIETDKGRDIRLRDVFEYEGDKYKTTYSNRLFLKETNNPLFQVTGRKMVQEGAYDYFDIDYLHVYRIERVDLTEIHVIRADNMTTLYSYSSPEECLHDFILLNNLWREFNGSRKKD